MTTEPTTGETEFRCRARQYSDQMSCNACGLLWDVNDKYPPPCNKGVPYSAVATTESIADALNQPYGEAAAEYRRLTGRPASYNPRDCGRGIDCKALIVPDEKAPTGHRSACQSRDCPIDDPAYVSSRHIIS